MNILSKLVSNGKWQDDVAHFVNREVYACASTLVYDLSSQLKEESEYYETLSTMFVNYDYEEAAQEYILDQDADERTQLTLDLEENSAQEFCNDHNIEPHDREVFEHWIVSKWLGNRLTEQDELVVDDFFGFTIWCRTTTGQSISSDYCINKIYYNCVENNESTKTLVTELTSDMNQAGVYPAVE